MSSPNNSAEKPEPVPATNFIRNIVEADLAAGKHAQRRWAGHPGTAADHAAAPLDPARIRTRFPPEPNGYLHFGHAKSILLNFGLAQQYGGRCHLRFDDTNPEKEEQEYVDSIIADVRWIAGDIDERIYYASDYFEQMYEYAVQLIKKGKAYVCDLTPQEIKQYRGTLTEPGKESPYRNRSVEENLELFEKMKNGEFKDGEKHCWASNKYIADFLDVSTTTVSTSISRLKEEGYIEIIEGEISYGSPKKTFALKKSIGDFRKVFSDLELKTIDDVNNAYVGLKPTEISKLSHSDFPYLATNDRKYIDYNLVKYRDTEETNQSKEDYSVFSSGEFSNIVGKFAKTLQDSGN